MGVKDRSLSVLARKITGMGLVGTALLRVEGEAAC
jgi:hypothetical protein